MKAATQKKADEKESVIYDADARNRFGYSVVDGDETFKTAQIFESLPDERYLQWLREFKIKGNDEQLDEQSREASVRLSTEIVVEVENVEVKDGEDWRVLLPYSERIEIINKFLAVSALAPEKVSDSKRTLAAHSTQTVITEAWFNGEVAQQTHVIKAKTLEWEKKYARIQSKRFKQEATRGLKGKPKVEFIPQDRKIGELYDEMLERSDGFASWTPLRFKTAVMHFVFEAEFMAEEKK